MLAAQQAERIMKKMEKDHDLPENQYAREALQNALAIMKDPTSSRKDSLAATRMVLEWTEAKPASKSEVTINEAEAWLASLDVEEGFDDDGSEAEEDEEETS